jgi:Vacuolar protein sorting-associated protein 35
MARFSVDYRMGGNAKEFPPVGLSAAQDFKLGTREGARSQAGLQKWRLAVMLTGIESKEWCGGWQSIVQPRFMEQIINCKDDIAQQYLMQCVIQCFPDEFHVGTLSQLINALPELQLGVKVHSIFSSLLDRLARYVALPGPA